jgi:hypothetical protein
MNPSTRTAISSVMRILLDNPLNSDFLVLPEDLLPDYSTRIEKPIDLERIHRNFKSGLYQTSREWYDDVCLVYTNTIKYYGVGAPWSDAAEYLLKQFKRIASELKAIDSQVWFTALNKRYSKFVSLVGNGPVPQGLDPVLAKISQASMDMVPLREKEIAQAMDWLNREARQGNAARDVIHLLSKLQPDLDFRTNDQVVIDAAKLNLHARQALTLYVKAQMTGAT